MLAVMLAADLAFLSKRVYQSLQMGSQSLQENWLVCLQRQECYNLNKHLSFFFFLVIKSRSAIYYGNGVKKTKISYMKWKSLTAASLPSQSASVSNCSHLPGFGSETSEYSHQSSPASPGSHTQWCALVTDGACRERDALIGCSPQACCKQSLKVQFVCSHHDPLMWMKRRMCFPSFLSSYFQWFKRHSEP